MAEHKTDDARLREAYGVLTAEAARHPQHPEEAAWERLACGELDGGERERLLDHVTACAACAEAYRALAVLRREARSFDPDAPAPPAQEGARRVGLPWPAWAGALAAGLAVVAVAGLLLSQLSRVPEAPVSAASPGAAPPPERPAALPVEKAPVKLSARHGLVLRGAEPRQSKAFLGALAHALEPYRAGDYTEAARRLEALASRYPKEVEPPFYLGVSLLLGERPREAIAALEGARARREPSFAADVGWYLALSYEREGEADRALAELRALCGSPGPYRPRACSAVEALTNGTSPPAK